VQVRASRLQRGGEHRESLLSDSYWAFVKRQLTPRQMEVCVLICDGLSDLEISARLGCSWNTAKHHLQCAFRVLGVNDRAQAMAVCFRDGIVDGSSRKPLPASLNPSERRTAEGLLQALPYRQIADMHERAIGTIKNQARNVFDKCGVWSRYELIARFTA